MTTIPVSEHGNAYILAAQIAASSTFQAVVNEGNQTDALTHIHYPYVDFDETGAVLVDLLPPRCIISDELGDEEWTSGGMHTWVLREGWWVSFDFPVPEAYSSEGTRNSWAWFNKQVRAILKDIQALGATGEPVSGKTYMKITAAKRVEGPYRIELAERQMHSATPETGEAGELWHVAYEIMRGF